MKPQHFALVAGSLLVAALVLLIMGRPQPGSSVPTAPPERYMITIGEGEVRVKPNQARVSLGIMTTGASASEAEAENVAAAARVRAALVASGVEAETVELSQSTLAAVTHQDYSGQVRISGFQAQVRVTGLLRNLTKVQGAIDSGLNAGATSLEEVTYTLDNPEEVQEQALAQALKAARARAEFLAEAEAQSIGDLKSLEVLEEPDSASGVSTGGLVFRARVRASFLY